MFFRRTHFLPIIVMAGLETPIFKELFQCFHDPGFPAASCGHCQLQCPGCQVLTCNWQKIVEAPGFFLSDSSLGSEIWMLEGFVFSVFCHEKAFFAG